ncbi:MAG: ATP-binding protein [Streptomyces sp.]|jgi:hypothetical protein|uniref:ATP-binding protein n=1 Tax=unclassified Streptomyces TaxID=2593676 RepID=UPI0025D993A7|nr:ATP-binding protein [Streptomyces sp.]MBW8801255.1 ATP-binding protein [Streptomyces sp.]
MELIGRDKDVGSIRDFFEAAGVRGGALLVVGDAGLGTTAVLDEFAAMEAKNGTRFLPAAGVQFGRTSTTTPSTSCCSPSATTWIRSPTRIAPRCVAHSASTSARPRPARGVERSRAVAAFGRGRFPSPDPRRRPAPGGLSFYQTWLLRDEPDGGTLTVFQEASRGPSALLLAADRLERTRSWVDNLLAAGDH